MKREILVHDIVTLDPKMAHEWSNKGPFIVEQLFSGNTAFVRSTVDSKISFDIHISDLIK